MISIKNSCKNLKKLQGRGESTLRSHSISSGLPILVDLRDCRTSIMLRILELLCILHVGIAIEQRAWMRADLDPAERARLLLPQMTLREKVDMCHGGPQDENWTGNIVGNPRLGIPRVQMNDGPQVLCV
jgi:hypothetical protein